MTPFHVIFISKKEAKNKGITRRYEVPMIPRIGDSVGLFESSEDDVLPIVQTVILWPPKWWLEMLNVDVDMKIDAIVYCK